MDFGAALSLTLCLGLTSCSAAGPGTPARPAAASRPLNIVLIMADDLGWGDLEPYGQTRIRTLNLVRMAREGTRFTDFYAGSTVCAPFRSPLITGQHTGHIPIRGNKEILPIGQEPLPAEAVTPAEVLEGRLRDRDLRKWGSQRVL